MNSRPKRVLVFNHFAAPRGQAGGTRHVELFSRLRGWQYCIVAANMNHLTGERQEAEKGFKPVPVLPYRANGIRRALNWASYAAMAVLQALPLRGVRVVYASSPHLLAGIAGWVYAALRRVPLILEIRDLWPQVLLDMGVLSERSLVYRALARLERLLYSRATQIVVMAQGTRVALEKRGVSSDVITYIPNGADPEDFRPSRSRERLRDRYGFGKFTAVYAGAHGPANGLDVLLNAAEELRDEPIDIVLIGGGVEKPRLVREAINRQLSNVRFMEPVPKREIADVLHAADAGLHILADVELFRSAISPNKVFDYMASATPVLTNSPGLVADLVQEANCGLAVAPQNVAEGLRQMLSNGTRGMGRAGADWITRNQSRSAMALRLQQLLDGVNGNL